MSVHSERSCTIQFHLHCKFLRDLTENITQAIHFLTINQQKFYLQPPFHREVCETMLLHFIHHWNHPLVAEKFSFPYLRSKLFRFVAHLGAFTLASFCLASMNHSFKAFSTSPSFPVLFLIISAFPLDAQILSNSYLNFRIFQSRGCEICNLLAAECWLVVGGICHISLKFLISRKHSNHVD